METNKKINKNGYIILAIAIVIIAAFLYNFATNVHPGIDALKIIKNETSNDNVTLLNYEIVDKTEYNQYLLKALCSVDTGYSIDGKKVSQNMTYYVIFYSDINNIHFYIDYAVTNFDNIEPTNTQLSIFEQSNDWGKPRSN